MVGLIVAFLCGSFVTVVLAVAGILVWLYPQSQKITWKDKDEKPYIHPQLPQSLQSLLIEDETGFPIREETCHWFNLIIAFVFREWRDSTTVKRFVMKKVNKEFEELMFTRTEGRIIEQLTVRDYFLGTSMPVIKSATVVKVEGDNHEIQEMDINLEVEYTGRCEMAIDADLVFDKAAYVAVEVTRLEGRGRLRFTRKEETSWSFAFSEDPLLELKVKSLFEGRGYPHLSSIIESQLKKWVKRKHTLPAYKKRFKPFFRKFKPQNQLLDVYVHDNRLTVGRLVVYVLECSRLPQVDGAGSVYCTVSVSSLPWQPMVHLSKTQWPVHEFVVQRTSEQTIGIIYKMVAQEDESNRLSMIVVSKVISPSAAYTAGVKKGDVLTRVNNVRVQSVRQARRLMKKFKETNSILITVQRPPAHFSSHVNSHVNTLSTSSPSARPAAGRVATPTDLDSVDSPWLEVSPVSDAAPATPTPGVPHNLSRTTSMLTETIQPIRSSRTPLSSEDERDVALGRLGTRRRGGRSVDSDTVSLCGVTGERGEEAPLPRGQVRVRHSYIHSGTVNEGTNSRSRSSSTRMSPSLSPVVSHRSSPSPPVILSPAPGDAVDLGAMSAAVEGARASGGETRRRNDRSREEHFDQKQTEEVQARKNPVWNRRFRFKINDSHCYLNVCVWEKLSEEKGDLLIGHVTIPLMDVAMECLHTKAGSHQQRYSLVAAQRDKNSTSRAAVQATASASAKKKAVPSVEEPEFAGDILLKFKHSPKLAESKNSKQTGTQELQSETFDHHHPVAHQDELPSRHVFSVSEEEGIVSKCDICRKKIWALKLTRPYKCGRCGLKCHKKCVDYCMKEVYCRRRDQPHQSQGRVSSENEETSSHHLLEQTIEHRHRNRSDSFEMLEKEKEEEEEEEEDEEEAYSSPDELMLVETEQGEEHTEVGQGAGQGVEQAGDEAAEQFSELDGDNVDGESDEYERLFTPLPYSDTELENFEVTPESPQLKWSSHLQPAERETAINKRLSDLQAEIDRIHELITNLYDRLHEPLIPRSEKANLEAEIGRYEEKLEPLKLLMNEMMSELVHCTITT